MMHALRRTLLMAALAVAVPLPALAAPDVSRKADFSALQRAEDGYRFETLRFTSADGARRYRVYLGIPEAAQGAHPAFFALDGNAVLEELTAARLRTLAASPDAPVLVLLGYDTDLRLDVVSRAFDYTLPAVQDSTAPQADALHPERKNGGADAFLDLLERHILPAVRERVALDTQRQTLWGHSYGGVLVLHTLMTRPALFRQYVAADPALWQGGGAVLQEQAQFLAAHADTLPPTTLWLMKSGQASPSTARQADAVQARARLMQRLPEGALTSFGKTLAESCPSLTVRMDDFPHDSHGSLFGRSFRAALFHEGGDTP